MVNAAIVAGAGPRIWLQEISRWKLQPEEMEWYVLPASRQAGEAAGLLVIFKDPSKVKGLEFLEAYTEIAPKLFIPLQSKLTPEIKAEEWKSLLIWDRQLFHPVLGFIGFEEKDRVEASALVNIGQAKDTDWSFANTGLPPWQQLSQIRIVQPSMDDLMTLLKKDIDQKPIEEIPGKDKGPSFLRKIFDRILLFFLKLLSWLFFGFIKIIPRPSGTSGLGNISDKEGPLEKAGKWLNKNIANLQEKRDREMERLLKMFEENQRDALEYAIPLNSPYLNRGETTTGGGWKLGRRPANFNPFSLGGGRAAEIWDLDNYRDSLREKYLKAAKKEIELKDFRRAAYIYAHLLGDYNAAANCLEQGGLYREAAALHKDHLKNNIAAAACLDRGGLYHEATVLYEELTWYEKAGELYEKIDDRQKAMASYEKHVEAKIKSNDYLDAARVLDKKMNDRARAKQELMNGWHSQYQPDQCLRKYFDMVMNGEEAVSKEIKQVYGEQTPPEKRKAFLGVLQYVKSKNRDESADQVMQDMAYEIVNGHAESGDLSLLNSLAGFVPKDKLLMGDSQRYQAKKTKSLFPEQAEKAFAIDQSVKWMSAIRHRSQVLILGQRNGFLQLARLNDEGVVDYFSWIHEITPHCNFRFVHADLQTDTVLLQTSRQMVIENKVLPKTKNFKDTIKISSPHWIQHRGTGFVITNENEVVSFNLADGELKLDYYTLKGDLQYSVPCEKGGQWIGPSLLYVGGLFISYYSKSIQAVTRDGKVNVFDLGSGIRRVAGAKTDEGLKIIVSTNKGCFLFLDDQEGTLFHLPEIFLETITPSEISHIVGNIFAMTEGKTVMFVTASDTKLRIFKELNYETQVLAVLPARSGRNSFVVIRQNGVVSVDRFESPE